MMHARTPRYALAALNALIALAFLLPQMSLAAGPEINENTPTAKTTDTKADAAGTATNGNTSADTVEFTPLTQLPGIKDAANSATLPVFLNQVYKICIGAGAVLAVIMIMIAGFEFMSSRGSVASNEKAKTRLRNALLGLLLVLSPTIVFGIINPKILDLDFTSDLQNLQQVRALDQVDTKTGQFQGADAYLFESTGSIADDTKSCTAAHGTLKFECTKKDESGRRSVTATDGCNADETKHNVCVASGTATAISQSQCSATYESNVQTGPLVVNGAARSCDASKGYQPIPHGCCVNSSPENNMCCGIPKTATYRIAYYLVDTVPNKPICRRDQVEYIKDQPTCIARLKVITDTAPYDRDGIHTSSPSIVNSCAAAVDTSYTFPDQKTPKC